MLCVLGVGRTQKNITLSSRLIMRASHGTKAIEKFR